MVYEGMIAESATVNGHNGDEIEAYYARPLGPGPFPGVVVIHHAPGWDMWTREVCRKLASFGYAAVSPHLYSRMGGGEPDDVAARARAEGGVPDFQVMGDVEGGMTFLRAQPYANGRVGVIGFCSGGRHTYLAAATIKNIDAAIDCWGGGVIVDDPAQITERRPTPPIEFSENITAPLMGLFGVEDANPTADQVDRTEEVLKKLGKNYEFHRYENAGHAFMCVDRVQYRWEQSVDAWKKVRAFFDRHLSAGSRVAEVMNI
jgi:carboxymethylenebutenolidase